jgi:hypothetical protein
MAQQIAVVTNTPEINLCNPSKIPQLAQEQKWIISWTHLLVSRAYFNITEAACGYH